MKKTKWEKRLLAALLCACLAFQSLPSNAFAAEVQETDEPQTENVAGENSDVAETEIITETSTAETEIITETSVTETEIITETSTAETIEQETTVSYEDGTEAESEKEEQAKTDEADLQADNTDIYVRGTGHNNKNVTWTLYTSGELLVEGTGEIVGSSFNDVPWHEYISRITSATINVTGATSAAFMFEDCCNLKNVDLSGFNTENVTDMSAVFRDCTSLTSVDLSSLDTKNVKKAALIFVNCSSLTTLDLSNFDTENVTDMSYMFAGCTSLTSVDLSSFNTENVTDMSIMFWECTSLTRLDISSFTFKSGQYVDNMLWGCSSLKEIVNPRNVGVHVELPATDDTCSWRKPDGTRVQALQLDLTETMVLSTDRKFGISFEGSNFTLAEYSGTRPADIEQVFDRGETESFTFTVVPDEGYVIQSVTLKAEDTKLTLVQGESAYQYTVAPGDAEKGYIRDEVISVKAVREVKLGLEIKLNSNDIEDIIVANGDSITVHNNTPVDADISNKYDTSVYVKITESSKNNGYIPNLSLRFMNVDNNNRWETKMVPYEEDTVSLSEKEKEYAERGYCIFRLGRLYDSAFATIDTQTACRLKFITDGFPGEVRIIQYVRNEYGVYQPQECEKEVIAEAGKYFYFQVEWSDTEDSAYKWCRLEINDNTGYEYSLSSTTLNGVEGYVNAAFPIKDTEILIELKPHTIEIIYNMDNILGLAVNNDRYAKLSEYDYYDRRQLLNVYGGNSLSLTFELDNGLVLQDLDSAWELTQEENGKCTISVKDMSAIRDIRRVIIDTYDSLGRISLSDPNTRLSIEPIFENGTDYTGKPIEASKMLVVLYYYYFDTTNREFRTILREGTDYILSYSNNINAGEARLIIRAAPDSTKYRGSYRKVFFIDKAESPDAQEKQLYVEYKGQAGMQQVDLSELFVINAKYDQNVKPVKYSLVSSSAGDVLDAAPTIEGSVLTYSIRDGAGRESAPASVTVNAEFENYKDTQLVLNIQPVTREKLALGGNVAVNDKAYDGKDIVPNADGLRVISQEGQTLNGQEAADILNKIKETLSYHYVGVDGTEYDSDEPPVDAGTYKVQARISDENLEYESEYFDAGTFRITQRKVTVVAEDVKVYKDDSLSDQYGYTADGLVEGDAISLAPVLSYTIQNTGTLGEYPILVDASGMRIINAAGRDVTANYSVSIREGTLSIREPEPGSCTLTYSLSGKGGDIRRSGMTAGSLIARPVDPEATGYVFLGWYKDKMLTQTWDFDTDTIQSDLVLYAGWSKSLAENGGMALYVQEIMPQTYTGKAIQPVITVYGADGQTLLNNGKDYTVTYVNNTDADTKKFSGRPIPSGGAGASPSDTSQGFDAGLAYAVITGKGNYTGTICMNFHIDAVDISTAGKASSGFTMKYTDQFEEKAGKTAAAITQFKYMTNTLKLGTDYTLTLKKAGTDTPVTITDKGQLPLTAGTYTLTVEGKDNYTGSIDKEIYVASKEQLMKNAKIKCTGTVADVTREQLAAGVQPQDLEVRIGNSWLSENDYTVECTNNHAVGTATVTVKGSGSSYFGSKSVTFKIKGTAFKEKEFQAISLQDKTYTGAPQTQNVTSLRPNNGSELIYGTDYTISYKDNIKKGKATMVFTANPSSGYSGSFKKTFTINAANLSSDDIVVNGAEKRGSKWTLTEGVPYQKGGATPAASLLIGETGIVLEGGKDYTITYKDNMDISTGKARMTIKGKGNAEGSVDVYFDIVEASFSQLYEEGRVTITPKSVKATFSYWKYRDNPEYDWEYELRDPTYEFEPSITVKDGKKTLTEDVDYEVVYVGNHRDEVEYGIRNPYAAVTGSKNYGEEFVTIPLSIYRYSLSSSTVYIVYADNDFTYTGQQITPKISAVYYGKASDIKKAKKNGETDEGTLTREKPKREPSGSKPDYEYGLTKLWEYNGLSGDYIVTYGANTAQGKNGKVTISGVGNYGGSVTDTFIILPQTVYNPVRE